MAAPAKPSTSLRNGCAVLRARLVVASAVTLVLVAVTITADAQMPAQVPVPPAAVPAGALPAVAVPKGAPSATRAQSDPQSTPVVSAVPAPAVAAGAPVGADAIVLPIRRIHPSRVAIEAKSKAKQAGKAAPKVKGASAIAGKANVTGKASAANVVVYSGGTASAPKR